MELIINRDWVKQAFAMYVRQYNAEDEKILLKIRHTYRVAEICERIAAGLGLPAYDTDLAWLIGMLHDIGRFEQLKQYGTFVDADSIDHAHFGVELLFQDGLIRDYVEWTETESIVSDTESRGNKERPFMAFGTESRKNEGDLCVIQSAIWNHSAYRIEDGLDERTLLFCKIIRDADKVDIFKVAYDTPLEVLYRCTAEEFRNAKVTPEVMQAYQERHAVLRSLKRTPVDFLVGHIALVFELEFPVSRNITREQGYLQKLLSFQSDRPETAMTFEDMRKQMKEFLPENG
ncbi:MAG: HD domain-containing protein [Lachnospiraceae bacterium]|nr:HD domain-containing protein [Lachnospiraceae bacterium]